MTLSPLPVEGRGAVATVTRSILQVSDLDNPADVLVMVLEPPRHGRLTRLHGDRALSRFKLEELSREQVQYVHDGSEGTEDGAVLQINDGHSYQNILLQININQKVSCTEEEEDYDDDCYLFLHVEICNSELFCINSRKLNREVMKIRIFLETILKLSSKKKQQIQRF